MQEFANQNLVWILLAITLVMGAVTAAIWFSWRIVALYVVRRSTRAAVLFGLSIAYAIFPFDFLIDPIFVDDLVLLALGWWQWKKARSVEPGAARPDEPIEARYTVSK